MALFDREPLPAHSTLSRFLAAQKLSAIDISVTDIVQERWRDVKAGRPWVRANASYLVAHRVGFWRYGARGVLATEFRVPDDFAAAFMKELYELFLSGKPLGTALLILRRSFWERQRNPLGLAYALYSPSSIRIVRE